MKRKTIEAMAEAIARTSGYWNADTACYQARNPGGLVAFKESHDRDATGLRVFPSVLDGMQALFYDVQLKLEGKARTKLLPSATLADFSEACGLQRTAAVNWAAFLRKALDDQTISHKSTIDKFLGE